MTATALEVPLRADIRRYSKRRLPDWVRPLTIGLLLIAVLAGAGARIHYAATYQPLQFGSGIYGPFGSGGFRPVNDGFATTRWLLVAKTGTSATFEYGIVNTGDDPVTIYDVPSDPKDWLYTSMAWTTMTYGDEPHKLPVVVKPHQTIELLFSVRQPACARDTAEESIQGIVVHYRAFGFDHTIVSLPDASLFQPLMICWNQR